MRMVLKGLNNSEIVYLDFKEIPAHIEDYKNIRLFFENCPENPRLPEHRQRFNNHFLDMSHREVLIGRYGEDRREMLKGSAIADQGRTIHLGVDLFTKEVQAVHSPVKGVVIKASREEGEHSFGYYVIVKYEQCYAFFGHLGRDLPREGTIIEANEKIGYLGRKDENGGWSIHVHVQLMRDYEELPLGYCTKEQFSTFKQRYPDPTRLLNLFTHEK